MEQPGGATLEEQRIEPLSFWLVDTLYLLSYSRPCIILMGRKILFVLACVEFDLFVYKKN